MRNEILNDMAWGQSSISSPESPSMPTIEDYERKLRLSQRSEDRLRTTLAAERTRLRKQSAILERQELLHRESCHRLLNGLQLASCLLSLESRAAAHVETTTQLASASRRIGMIAHIHRHLNGLERERTTMISLREFLAELCRDFSAVLSADCVRTRSVVIEGIDIDLPMMVASSLGMITSELITNAVKHGQGRITVELSRASDVGYTLSVSDDVSMPMKERDDTGGSGLGMIIIESLARQIGAKVSVNRGAGNWIRGASVSFIRPKSKHKIASWSANEYGGDMVTRFGFVTAL
ncbi:MAG: sensor histidine kinase [Rhizomicrobium sp.]